MNEKMETAMMYADGPLGGRGGRKKACFSFPNIVNVAIVVITAILGVAMTFQIVIGKLRWTHTTPAAEAD